MPARDITASGRKFPPEAIGNAEEELPVGGRNLRPQRSKTMDLGFQDFGCLDLDIKV